MITAKGYYTFVKGVYNFMADIENSEEQADLAVRCVRAQCGCLSADDDGHGNLRSANLVPVLRAEGQMLGIVNSNGDVLPKHTDGVLTAINAFFAVKTFSHAPQKASRKHSALHLV
ncbi:hypothetical protein COB52_01475 [Candidatus Kaiserbacteria bacterium]|nr:MAG: hypothetical protein COB52_01475 [Candidatus Kaiserbacteria bacterium]